MRINVKEISCFLGSISEWNARRMKHVISKKQLQTFSPSRRISQTNSAYCPVSFISHSFCRYSLQFFFLHISLLRTLDPFSYWDFHVTKLCFFLNLTQNNAIVSKAIIIIAHDEKNLFFFFSNKKIKLYSVVRLSKIMWRA